MQRPVGVAAGAVRVTVRARPGRRRRTGTLRACSRRSRSRSEQLLRSTSRRSRGSPGRRRLRRPWSTWPRSGHRRSGCRPCPLRVRGSRSSGCDGDRGHELAVGRVAVAGAPATWSRPCRPGPGLLPFPVVKPERDRCRRPHVIPELRFDDAEPVGGSATQWIPELGCARRRPPRPARALRRTSASPSDAWWQAPSPCSSASTTSAPSRACGRAQGTVHLPAGGSLLRRTSVLGRGPGGHSWTFSESIADVAPEDWGGTSVDLG